MKQWRIVVFLALILLVSIGASPVSVWIDKEVSSLEDQQVRLEAYNRLLYDIRVLKHRLRFADDWS